MTLVRLEIAVRIRSLTFALVGATLALAGCAGSSPGSPPLVGTSSGGPSGVDSVRSAPMPDTFFAAGARRQLYAANTQNNTIDIYPVGVPNPKLVGTITKGISKPADVYVDAAGTIYVANQGGPTVTVYPNAAAGPSRTIQLPFQPFYITAARDGTIFVLETDNNQNSRIDEFDPGAKKSSRHIEYPSGLSDPVFAAGLATDARSNLYVNVGALNGGSNFAVSVYRPKKTKSFTGYGSGGNYAYGGIVVDSEDRLIVGDPYDQYTFVAQLPNEKSPRFINNAQSGDYVALDAPSNYLYTVSLGSSTLQVYNLKTGKAIALLHGFTGGVAVGPGFY